ncbi:hypothetical protein KCP73_06505 [Salmonella enterica subsp. enterica]|nr:hypothetical protein KCP73_06505 [Salmonella enterica subsp. enterica]
MAEIARRNCCLASCRNHQTGKSRGKAAQAAAAVAAGISDIAGAAQDVIPSSPTGSA